MYIYEIKKRREDINRDMLKYVDQEEKACMKALYLNGYRKIGYSISCSCPDICIVHVFNPTTKDSRGFMVDKDSMLQYIPNDEDACKMYAKEHEEYESKRGKKKTLFSKLCKIIKH